MNKDFESAQDKAARLGVRLIEPVKWPQPMKEIDGERKDVKAMRDKLLARVTAVCGGCGKEMTMITSYEPCGQEDCPFGLRIS